MLGIVRGSRPNPNLTASVTIKVPISIHPREYVRRATTHSVGLARVSFTESAITVATNRATANASRIETLPRVSDTDEPKPARKLRAVTESPVRVAADGSKSLDDSSLDS